MCRRIVPVTLWVGILFWAVLLLAEGVVWASRLADRVPNVVGAWDGFFQEDAVDGPPGLVLSNITEQVDRRIAGNGLLFDIDASGLFENAINFIKFNATVARDDFIVGTGLTPTGQFVFHAGLETFAGGAGDAGVTDTQYLLTPVQGSASRINAILLHPFGSDQRQTSPAAASGRFKVSSTRASAGDSPCKSRRVCAVVSAARWISYPNRACSHLFPGESARRPATRAASS